MRASRTVVRLLDTDKGVGWDYGNTPHVLEIVNASYNLLVAGNQNCGVPLALTNRVARDGRFDVDRIRTPGSG
jgi:hypothetical protein